MEGGEINATVIIRKARKEDMVQVYKLIKELAEFEKLEHQVKINETDLIQDGFETEQHPHQSAAFECFVAEIPNNDHHHNIIGYALYYQSYSTWLGRSIFLEDIYVQPAHRRNGIGKELFMTVAKIAHKMPSKHLDFHVLSWNNTASEFYKHCGAINLTTIEKWELFRLNEDALNRLFSN